MLPPRVLELVFDSSDSPPSADGDMLASTNPATLMVVEAYRRAALVAPTALPAPPRMPSDAVHVPAIPRLAPVLSLVDPESSRPSRRPTVRVGANRSRKMVRVLRPSGPPPPSMPPPPGSAPIRKAA